jgi:photosystem II stability/assembly factor-like uncharacterized protein
VKSKSIGSLILLAILAPSCGGGGGSSAPPKAPILVKWQTQQRVPTSSDLRTCIFANPNQGIIAGKNGVIFRTDDGGATWVQQEFLPSNRTGDILAMSAYGVTILAAGTDGVSPTLGRIWDGRNSTSWVTVDAPANPLVPAYTDINVSDPGLGNVPGSWWALRNDGFIDFSFNGSSGTQNARSFPPLPPLWPAGPPTAPQHPVDWTESNCIAFIGVTGFGLVGGRDNGLAPYGGDPGDPMDPMDDIPADPGHGPEGQIARTSDFGVNWIRQIIMPSHPKTFRRFFITTATTGVTRGYSVADSTTDNGQLYVTNYGIPDQWDRVTGTNVPNSAARFRALSFPVNDLTGWVVGDGGTIWKITATATATPPITYTYTWTNQSPGAGVTVANLYAVSFPDNNTGFAVGDGGVVIKTVNGGTTWTRISSGTGGINFNAVAFTDNGLKGIAVGDAGVVYRTSNGGLNWSPMTPIAGTPNLFGAAVPRFGSGNVAYLCGANGTLQRNPDAWGAGVWTQGTGTTGTDTYKAILFPQGDVNGVCVGNVTGGAPKILSTSTGTAWTTRTATTAPTGAYNALSTIPTGGRVFAASGADGRISDSTDVAGGFATWTDAPSPLASLTLLSIASPNGPGFTAFTGANNGRVLRLPAGSGTWATPGGAAPFGGSNATSLAFQGDLLGTTVTSTGTIWTTDNSGTSWLQSFAHTKDTPRALWMSPTVPGLGYIVCNDGTILKTTTGGK